MLTNYKVIAHNHVPKPDTGALSLVKNAHYAATTVATVIWLMKVIP